MKTLQHYIDGRWVSPIDPGSVFPVINPADETQVAEIRMGSAADVELAVAAAHRAFASFAATPLDERLEMLRRLKAIFVRRIDEMADAITTEMGAPHDMSRDAQAASGPDHIEATLVAALKLDWETRIGTSNAVTFAAGIACEGQRPVLAIYSTFLQRGYDQLIHDVALQNLPVLFAIDRAGLVGADGATHAGVFDYAYLRCVPNMVVMAPKDERECRQMLNTGLAIDGPSAVRYPRGAGSGVDASGCFDALEVGKAECLRDIRKPVAGARIAILAFGSMVTPALAAAEALDATVVNMRFVKPLDMAMIERIANSHDMIVTVEEHVVSGGAGSACAEALVALGDRIPMVPIVHLGLPDRFIDQGDHQKLLALEGLDAKGIEAFIRGKMSLPLPLKAVS